MAKIPNPTDPMEDIENSGAGKETETPNQDNSPNTTEDTETLKAEAKEKRYLEQLKGAQQELAVRDELDKVRSNGGSEYAIKLAQSNKEMAEKVAKKLGYANAREMIEVARSQIDPNATKTVEDPEVIVERRFVARTERDFFAKLSNEEADLVRAEYEDITYGKELTAEQAEKYLKKAQTLALPEKKEPAKKYSTASVGGSNTSTSSKKETDEAIAYLKSKRR